MKKLNNKNTIWWETYIIKRLYNERTIYKDTK